MLWIAEFNVTICPLHHLHHSCPSLEVTVNNSICSHQANLITSCLEKNAGWQSILSASWWALQIFTWQFAIETYWNIASAMVLVFVFLTAFLRQGLVLPSHSDLARSPWLHRDGAWFLQKKTSTFCSSISYRPTCLLPEPMNRMESWNKECNPIRPLYLRGALLLGLGPLSLLHWHQGKWAKVEKSQWAYTWFASFAEWWLFHSCFNAASSASNLQSGTATLKKFECGKNWKNVTCVCVCGWHVGFYSGSIWSEKKLRDQHGHTWAMDAMAWVGAQTWFPCQGFLTAKWFVIRIAIVQHTHTGYNRFWRLNSMFIMFIPISVLQKCFGNAAQLKILQIHMPIPGENLSAQPLP